MSKRLAVLLVTLSALVLVPSAAAKDLKGVVVKVDPSQLAVARDNGDVELVRTALAAKAHVGQRVQIDGRRERGGAFVPERIRLLGDARTARLKGTVLSANPASITLAARGVTLSIALGTHKPLPVGARVDLDVGFAGQQLVLARVGEVEIEQEDADDDDNGVVEREHEGRDDDHGGGGDHSGPGGGDDGGGHGDG